MLKIQIQCFGAHLTSMQCLKAVTLLQSEVSTSGRSLEQQLSEAVSIRELLKRNTEETEGIVRALNGEYILPEAGGDLLRDGAGVLPTGEASRDISCIQ